MNAHLCCDCMLLLLAIHILNMNRDWKSFHKEELQLIILIRIRNWLWCNVQELMVYCIVYVIRLVLLQLSWQLVEMVCLFREGVLRENHFFRHSFYEKCQRKCDIFLDFRKNQLKLIMRKLLNFIRFTEWNTINQHSGI